MCAQIPPEKGPSNQKPIDWKQFDVEVKPGVIRRRIPPELRPLYEAEQKRKKEEEEKDYLFRVIKYEKYQPEPFRFGDELEQAFWGDPIQPIPKKIFSWSEVPEFKGFTLTSKKLPLPPLDCINVIKKYYPENLKINPKTKVCQDLYYMVAKKLNLPVDQPEILKQRLHLYNTLGSPLDLRLETDGFFLYMKGGEEYYCSIDTSLDIERKELKKEKFEKRADIIIYGFPNPEKNWEKYQEWLDWRSEMIVEVLKTKPSFWL